MESTATASGMKWLKVLGIAFMVLGVLFSITVIFLPLGIPMFVFGIVLFILPRFRRAAMSMQVEAERDLDRLRRETP